MNIHLGTGEFILSKRRGKGNMRVPVERRDLGPTPERLAKADSDYLRFRGDEGLTGFVMRDAPLDSMYTRHGIDPV